MNCRETVAMLYQSYKMTKLISVCSKIICLKQQNLYGRITDQA